MAFEQSASSTNAKGVQFRNLDPTLEEDQSLLNQFSAIMNENCTSENPPTYTLNITNFY